MPKMHTGRNSKWRDKIAKGYVNYLKGRELCHNIITQGVEGVNEQEALSYTDAEARVIVCYIQHTYVNMQLPKALQKFGSEGQNAAKAEVKQLHDRVCFKALTVSELTKQEKERAMEGLMLVTQKRTSEWKGRIMASPPENG